MINALQILNPSHFHSPLSCATVARQIWLTKWVFQAVTCQSITFLNVNVNQSQLYLRTLLYQRPLAPVRRYLLSETTFSTVLKLEFCHARRCSK
ncbi:hypothetical protein FGIG_10581 [Fasciola gigantica]|uniref:Uncharacterized protein n=1 Tax=Fasciola gigantica TaxID=46835 RepID=A0A504YHX7_FASGI|nr:hypothetical protein FGIG_10581 [Fasciola gigantica]